MSQKRKILIVDDEADFAACLAELFEGEGYLVETAENGREALSRLADASLALPSVVILDLRMPTMNGAEVLSAMRADTQLASIPVILSTSDPSPTAPGVLIMRKPFNIDRMLEAVRRLTN